VEGGLANLVGCWAVGPGKWAMVFFFHLVGAAQHQGKMIRKRGGGKQQFYRNIYRKVTCMLVKKSYERGVRYVVKSRPRQ